MFVSSFLAPKSIVLIGLYFFILFFTYTFQNLAFTKKISESLVTGIMWFICIVYMFASILIVIKLELPLVLTGYLNLYTVSLLLKVISYSHVLNSIRYYISVLKTEKNAEIIEETLAEVSSNVF